MTTPPARLPLARPFPLGLFFLLDGVLMASWAVCIPAVKLRLDISTTALGTALLCTSLGSLLSMTLSGPLVVRFGTRRVTVVTCLLASAWLPVLALAGSVVWLAVALALFGLVYGADNIALNSAAVEVETAGGRPRMSMLHGLWSVGMLLGSLLGGLLAHVLSTGQYLSAVGAAGVVLSLAAGTVLLRQPGAETAGGKDDPAAAAPPLPWRRALTGPVALFGVVALCTAFSEGAVADWTGLHMREDLHSGASLAAYTFAAYNVSIAAGRLIGSRLVARHGSAAVLGAGGALAAAGILVAAWSPLLPVAVAGFVAVGFGLANVFPLAIARAGAVGGPNGVSLASGIGNTGMLAGPPLIGFLADHAGLPTALSSLAVAGTAITILAVAARKIAAERQTPADGPADGPGHPTTPPQQSQNPAVRAIPHD